MEQTDSRATNATTNFPIQPGDTKFHDVNGDDVIDEFDKVKWELPLHAGPVVSILLSDGKTSNYTDALTML